VAAVAGAAWDSATIVATTTNEELIIKVKPKSLQRAILTPLFRWIRYMRDRTSGLAVKKIVSYEYMNLV
jgi:hypothetical protein